MPSEAGNCCRREPAGSVWSSARASFECHGDDIAVANDLLRETNTPCREHAVLRRDVEASETSVYRSLAPRCPGNAIQSESIALRVGFRASALGHTLQMPVCGSATHRRSSATNAHAIFIRWHAAPFFGRASLCQPASQRRKAKGAHQEDELGFRNNPVRRAAPG